MQTFDPSLIIDEHFEALINRIDIKTETLLQESIQNAESDCSKRVNDLNDLRDKQIEKIKEVKELNQISLGHFTEKDYDKRLTGLINDTLIEYESKVDQIKTDLISVDCVLLEQFQVLNGFDLWITDCFYNSKNLEILK